MLKTCLILIASLAVLTGAPAVALAEPPWRTLPPPAPLPAFDQQGRVDHDGARLWYASFGAGPPVILLHGGDASSDFWGDQVPALTADGHRVIVIDSRGHGRSTRDARPLSYVRMESDVIAVMDDLGLRQAAVVGWSDGAIIGLIMAMHDPDRVSRVFAFGANMDLCAFNPFGAFAPILPDVHALLAADYARISPTPDGYASLARAVLLMQMTQPTYAPADLAAIHGPAVEIADGDHEEFIRRGHTRYLARTIPGAQLALIPGGGHFAPLQTPDAFNAAMIAFLDGPDGAVSSRRQGRGQSHAERASGGVPGAQNGRKGLGYTHLLKRPAGNLILDASHVGSISDNFDELAARAPPSTP